MNQPPSLSILVLSGTAAIVTGFFLSIATFKGKVGSIQVEKAVVVVNSMITGAHCITLIGSSGAPIDMIVLEDMRLTFQLGTWFAVIYFLLIVLERRAKSKSLESSVARNWLILMGILVLGYASTLMALSTMGGIGGSSAPFMVMPGSTEASLGIASSVFTILCGVFLIFAAILLVMDKEDMKKHVALCIISCISIAFILQITAALIPTVSSINTGMPAAMLPTNFVQFVAVLMVFQWYPSFYANVAFLAIVALMSRNDSKSGDVELKGR